MSKTITELPSRIPPHDPSAELAALGACVIDPDASLPLVLPRLVPSDFYPEHHRIIYRHIVTLANAGASLDLTTLGRSLADAGELDLVGGYATLASLIDGLTPAIPSHVDSYVRSILVDAGKRDVIQRCTEAINRAYSGAQPHELANEVGDALTRIAERSHGEARPYGPQALGTVVRTFECGLDAAETSPVVPTPIPELSDRLEGGLRVGEVAYLKGPAAAAKTALAIQWAALAAQASIPTVIFSREMLVEGLARRFLAQQLRIPAGHLRRRNITTWQRQNIRDAFARFDPLPLALDDTSETIGAIRRVVRQHQYRFVVVDYLQLVGSPPDARDERRELEAVSRALKRLAMRGCSVLALSAVARLPVEERGKKSRPRYVLRGSERLQHDADVVLTLYRPDDSSDDRVMEFEKIRDGRSGGSATLSFNPMFVTFDEVGEEGSPF